MNNYAKRIKLEKLCDDKEWINILDRLVLNLFNGEPKKESFDKAQQECEAKNIQIKIPQSKVLSLISKPNSGKIPTEPPDERTRAMLEFLMNKYPQVSYKKCMKCVLRYATLGMNGQQWASVDRFMDFIKSKGCDVECFASPFNNSFPKYYSLFEEDSDFGSLGNFFKQTINDLKQHTLYANPPFVPALLDKMAKILIQVPRAVIITPTWPTADWYRLLRENGYRSIMKPNAPYTAMGKVFTPKFVTTAWYKGINLL